MLNIDNYFIKLFLYLSGNEPSDYHEIIPNLYLGNSTAAEKYSNNFDIIINVTPNIPFYSKKTKNIRISVNDDLTNNSNLILAVETEKILPYLNDYLKNNKKVLIHCRAGMQRSATLVASYLIRYKKYDIEQAKKIIKNKRNIAFVPYTNFNNTLTIIYNNTYKNKSLRINKVLR
jgi:protein-tyrosine phosphatase